MDQNPRPNQVAYAATYDFKPQTLNLKPYKSYKPVSHRVPATKNRKIKDRLEHCASSCNSYLNFCYPGVLAQFLGRFFSGFLAAQGFDSGLYFVILRPELLSGCTLKQLQASGAVPAVTRFLFSAGHDRGLCKFGPIRVQRAGLGHRLDLASLNPQVGFIQVLGGKHRWNEMLFHVAGQDVPVVHQSLCWCLSHADACDMNVLMCI